MLAVQCELPPSGKQRVAATRSGPGPSLYIKFCLGKVTGAHGRYCGITLPHGSTSGSGVRGSFEAG